MPEKFDIKSFMQWIHQWHEWYNQSLQNLNRDYRVTKASMKLCTTCNRDTVFYTRRDHRRCNTCWHHW